MPKLCGNGHGHKRQFALLGALKAANATNFNVGRTIQCATQQFA